MRLPRAGGPAASLLLFFRSFTLEPGDTRPLLPGGSCCGGAGCCEVGGGGGGGSRTGGGAVKTGLPRPTASGPPKAKPPGPPPPPPPAGETRGTQPVGSGRRGGLGSGGAASPAAGPSPPGGGSCGGGGSSSRSSSSSSDSFRFRTFTRRALRNIPASAQPPPILEAAEEEGRGEERERESARVPQQAQERAPPLVCSLLSQQPQYRNPVVPTAPSAAHHQFGPPSFPS